MVRKYNGRRKTEMVKMKNETNLRVTFSKRKSGLFKKASELCTLCDAQVALIVFSPSGKVFSFGHPNVDVLFDRLSRRSQTSIPRLGRNTELESNTNSYLQYLNNMLTQVLVEKQKEKEKKKRYKIIKKERLNNSSENWFEKPPEELNLTQATQMKHIVEDLKKKVDDLLYSRFQQTIIPHHNYHVGSNVAPGTVHGGNIYTNQSLFDQNRSMMGTNTFRNDPNMITPNHSLPSGSYHHDNNNSSERFLPGCDMNRIPWYHQSQIPKQEFNQGHPHYGPRY